VSSLLQLPYDHLLWGLFSVSLHPAKQSRLLPFLGFHFLELILDSFDLFGMNQEVVGGEGNDFGCYYRGLPPLLGNRCIPKGIRVPGCPFGSDLEIEINRRVDMDGLRFLGLPIQNRWTV